MRLVLACYGFASIMALAACDSQKEPDLGIPKTKDISELQQSSKSKMSKEELDEARRKAGFKTKEDEEREMAEAKAAYERSEQAFVKGRVDQYRALIKELRTHLGKVEKAAKKWAEKDDATKEFERFAEAYKKDQTAFFETYDELTEKGSRGGNLQVTLDHAVRSWESLGKELSAEIAKADGFDATLQDIRTKLDEVEATIAEIEKDESVEAEEPEKKG